MHNDTLNVTDKVYKLRPLMNLLKNFRITLFQEIPKLGRVHA